MPQQSLTGGQPIKVSDSIILQPSVDMQGQVGLQDRQTPVLGGAADTLPTTTPMLDFTPASDIIELDLQPRPDIVGTIPGTVPPPTIQTTYDPGENAVYALLHTIETPDGTIYDLTLQQPALPSPILGGAPTASPTLTFPFNRLVYGNGGLPPPATTPSPVLGGIGDVIASAVTGEAVRHLLQVVKAPISEQLAQQIAASEPQPQVLTINPDATIGAPLVGAELWRQQFLPGKRHRVLLFIHGFTSTAQRSLPTQWIQAFAPAYDAVLGYTHPSITRDPRRNASDLLAMIPPDVELDVDIIAHSRGGLVARSLVELQPINPSFHVRTVIMAGTPNNGTLLADPTRWDRLISIGFTVGNWLTRLAVPAAELTFVPRALELLLRAAAQLLLDLPGVQAMTPGNTFLQQLNLPSDPNPTVRYATLSSKFNPLRVEQVSIREALQSLAVSAFVMTPNDMVIPTASMSQIDLPGSPLLAGRDFETSVHHFGYFDDLTALAFARNLLVTRV